MLIRAVLFLMFFAVPAAAQSLFDAGGGNGDTAAAQNGTPASVLIEILRDDAAREDLIRQLEAAATGPGTPLADVPPPEDAPMSLARQIAEYTRGTAEASMAFVFDLADSADDLLGVFTGDSRVNWPALYSAAIALSLVMAITIGLFFVLRAIGMRIFSAMANRTGRGNWLMSGLWLVASSVIDALLIILAWGGGYAFALLTGEAGSMDFRQTLFLNAFLLVEMTKVILRAVLSPGFDRLRFLPVSHETAAYWYFWASRLTSLLGYGALLVVPTVNAVASYNVGQSILMLIALTALMIAVLLVFQNRAPVSAALRARNLRDPEDIIGRIEAYFAGVWHWLAVAYLVALFVIWSTRPGDALQFMLVATLTSVIAVAVGAIAMAFISRAITGGMRLPDEVRHKLPLLETRLNAFVPNILKVVRVLIMLAVVIAIAQAWQVMDFLGWVASEVGRATTARVVSAVLVVLVTWAIWLAMSSYIEYRLNPAVSRIPTARERTLLALFRNAFTIALIVIGVMLTLAELGVNIAPLLAGAGVLGLAIGFGAQKLVQDIITGAFIQFENAMNEGDVVTAGGTTGVVEKLTIRSVGLRDLSGTYHLIPFSSVDMVSNFMKGFAFHVAEIGVAYREDVTEVRGLLQDAFDILAAGDLGPEILEPLDIMGVTELGDSAVTVRARIKTKPGMQWAVGRAYNEIIKQVLDDAGVEIPFPHMTIYMGQDKDGSAPPLNLRRAARDTIEGAAAPAKPVPGVQDARTPGPGSNADGDAAERTRRDQIIRTMPDRDEDNGANDEGASDEGAGR